MAENTLAMPRLSLRLLGNVVGFPGVLTKVPDLHRAGRVAVRIEDIMEQFPAPEVSDPQRPTDQESGALKAWGDEGVEMFVSNKELEVCKTAVKGVCDKGGVTAGRPFVQLVEALGMVDDDD